MGRSQVSTSIIVGLVIVIVLAGFFVTKAAQQKDSLGQSSENVVTAGSKQNTLEAFVLNCVRRTAINAEIEYGLDAQVSLPFIKNYISYYLPMCFDEFKVFKQQGYDVETGDLKVDAQITSEALIVDISYPLNFQRDDTLLTFDKQTYTFPRAVYEKINFNDVTRIVSSDGQMQLEIPAGTVATLNGRPLKEVGVKIVDRGFHGLSNNVLSAMLAYEGIPHGTKFSKPIKVTYFYRENQIPIYYPEENLNYGYYDSDTGIWVGLPTEVDTVRNMITSYPTHFSQGAVVKDCSKLDGATGYVVTPTLIKEDCYPCEANWDLPEDYQNYKDAKSMTDTAMIGEVTDCALSDTPLEMDLSVADCEKYGGKPAEECGETKEECEDKANSVEEKEKCKDLPESSDEVSCKCELKVYKYEEALKGKNSYKISFQGGGNTCIESADSTAENKKYTAVAKAGTELGKGDGEIVIEPKCLEGDTCALDGDPVLTPGDTPFIEFKLKTENGNLPEACINAYAIVEFQGIGAIDAEYTCDKKGATDFIKGDCRTCVCPDVAGEGPGEGCKWNLAETAAECYDDTTCSPSMRGVVREFGEAKECQICTGGKWVPQDGGVCSGVCEEQAQYNTPTQLPAAQVVNPPGIKGILGRAISDITGKATADGEACSITDSGTTNMPSCTTCENSHCPTDFGYECCADDAPGAIALNLDEEEKLASGTECDLSESTSLPDCNDCEFEHVNENGVLKCGSTGNAPNSGMNGNGESCDDDRDCQSGRCDSGKCYAKDKLGEVCGEDSDCETNRCEWTHVIWKTCVGRLGSGGSCNEPEDCVSQICTDNACIGNSLDCTVFNEDKCYLPCELEAGKCKNPGSEGVTTTECAPGKLGNCENEDDCTTKGKGFWHKDTCYETEDEKKCAESKKEWCMDKQECMDECPEDDEAEALIPVPSGRCLLPSPQQQTQAFADCAANCVQAGGDVAACIAANCPTEVPPTGLGTGTGTGVGTGTGTGGGGSGGGGGGGGGNENCPTGEIKDGCSGIDLAPYKGKKIKTDKALDTRNKNLCDTGLDLAAGTDLIIFGSSKEQNGACWVFVESQQEINGEAPDVYVRYDGIKHLLGITEETCEKDEDCKEGYVCRNKVCVQETQDLDVEIKAIYGFSALPTEDFAEAKKLDALTVGVIADSPTKAIEAAKANNLETVIIYTGKNFDAAVENEKVTGYILPSSLCAEGTKKEDEIKNLIKQYANFRKTNKKTPVMINFEKLDCAIDYIDLDKDKKKFVDVILFNVKPADVPDLSAPDYIIGQKKIAEQLIKRGTEMYNGKLAIIPVVDLKTEEGLKDAVWAESIGKMLLQTEEDGKTVPDSNFRGILFVPWKDSVQVTQVENAPIKVAFVANQKADDTSVLKMIKDEKANITIHLGNFGHDNAREWNTKIVEIFDKTDGKTNLVPYPYVGVKGTFDKKESWINTDPKDLKNDYGDIFDERFKAIASYNTKNKITGGLECAYGSVGLLGYKMTCTYGNVYFILSGVGIMPNEGTYEGHDQFILDNLKREDRKDYWRICGWNRANMDLRVGDMPDNENLKKDYYDFCLNNSAIVVTGFESNYARTKTVTDIQAQSILTTGDPDKIELADKRNVIINSGLLGGQTPYSAALHGSANWWASMVAPNKYVKSGSNVDPAVFGQGALFITFNVGKDETKAKGEFKAIVNGEVRVLDTFEITKVVVIDPEQPKSIFEVRTLQEYINAFKNVFKIAKENYVLNQDCGTNPSKCKTKAQCEDAKFIWDAVNNKCVECLVNADCKCGGQVCTTVVKTCQENVCITEEEEEEPPQETLLYTFAIIGDYGTNDANEKKVSDMVKSWGPSFIITTGDNTYLTSGQPYQSSVGAYYGEYVNSKFYPSIGEHDVIQNSLQLYTDYFSLPGNERYYDFSKEKANFYVVNTELEADGKTFDSVQGTWLKNKLAASTAKFDVVIMHRPSYATCYAQPEGTDTHCSAAELQWPFKDWGANVVVSGHNNVYERLEKDGLTYLVNGIGGSSLGTFGTPIAESKFRYNQKLGAIKAKVYDSKIIFELVNENGEVKDTYELK